MGEASSLHSILTKYRSPLKYDALDIVHLRTSRFSGERNAFQLQAKRRLPIPLEKNGLSTIISAQELPLFSGLPIELLTEVVALLDPDALAAFASVNRVCRLLVRSVQFENTTWDYHNLDFVIHLALEALETQDTPRSLAMKLGPSVRRLKIATNPSALNAGKGVSPKILGALSRKQRNEAVKRVLEDYFEQYLALVKVTIEAGLPNLELLDWRDKIRMDSDLLKTILQSHLKHLKLVRIEVDKTDLERFYAMPVTESNSLETLEIEVVTDIMRYEEYTYASVAQILKHCVRSLRKLTWNSRFATPNDIDDYILVEIPPLNQLRELSLSSIKMQAIADIRSLIPNNPTCKLIHLDLTVPDEDMANYLADRGNIATLSRLVWTSSEIAAPISFLEANPQIELLSLQTCSSSYIDFEVLPLLVRSFRCLRSLELIYKQEENMLSEDALSQLSKLKQLEKLHLSRVPRFGCERTWVVDHSALRACVKLLPDLKMLALSRDTYDVSGDIIQVTPERYYSQSVLPRVCDDVEWRLTRWVWDEHNYDGDHLNLVDHRRRFAFEMIHRRHMLKEAAKYVRLRYNNGPKLDFLYFGELPMRVRYGWYGWRANAVTERRDDLHTFLQRTFQAKDDVFDRQ